MTAKRVIDDHLELANIGTKTHAQLETHLAGIGNYIFPATDGAVDEFIKTDGAGNLSWAAAGGGFACDDLGSCSLSQLGTRPHSQLTGIGTSDHHVKYTDAEAVAAADASEKFIERNVENAVTGKTTLKKTSAGTYFPDQILIEPIICSSDNIYQDMNVGIHQPYVRVKGTAASSYTIGSVHFLKPAGKASSIQLHVRHSSGGWRTPIQIYDDKIDVKSHPIKDIKNHADATLSGTPKVIELLIGATSYYFKAYPTKT